MDDVDDVLSRMGAHRDAPRRALEIYEAASANVRQSGVVRYAAGAVHFQLGELEASEADFRAAMAELGPRADVVVNLATTLIARAKRDHAEPDQNRERATEALQLLDALHTKPEQSDPRESALVPAIDQLRTVARSLR